MDFGKLTLYRQGEQPQEFRLRLGSLSIGSDPTADISVDDSSIDAFHLRVVCTPAGCQLTDLGSRLGTLVNKERIAPHRPVRLQDGDRVRFGRAGLIYTAPKVAPQPAQQQPVQPTQPAQPVVTTEQPPVAAPDPQPAVTATTPEERPEARPAVPAAPTEPPAAPQRQSVKTQPLAPPDDWATLFELPAAPSSNGAPVTVLPSNRRRKLPRNEERGLPYEADDYLALLPPIYHDQRFLQRFLLIFKSILSPLDRQIAQISHYFDPRLAPEPLLPWLASWVDLTLDERWPDTRRRELIRSASVLYRWRGTRRGLLDYLRIYIGPGADIRIVEQGQEQRNLGEEPLPPHTFRVIIEAPRPSLDELDRGLLERIIELEKPAHTAYQLELRAV